MVTLMSRFVSFAQQGLGAAQTAAADATASGAAGTGTEGPNPMSSFLLFGVMIVVFYFLLIRPQQKRQKTHVTFVKAIKRGDQVITNSGIYGRIQEIQDHVVILEIAKNVHIKVLKNQVACQQTPEGEGGVTKDDEALRDAAA
jgi:preprotein translocase subunit YajC